MKNNKWTKYRDKINNKCIEAVQWNGRNQLEIYDFLKYLFWKRNEAPNRIETKYCELDNTLTITIGGGLIKARLEVGNYVVEYDNAPFAIYDESAFKQRFSVEGSFKAIYKDYVTSHKNDKCTDDSTKESSNKKQAISLLNQWAFVQIDITNVIFNDPATIVTWGDGSKTVVKCQDGDDFDKEKGLAMAISKKVLGNKSNFNNTFKHFIGEEEESSSFCSRATADAITKRLNSIFKVPKTPTYYDKLGTQNKNFIDIISVAYGYDCETLSKLLVENNFNRSLMLKALIESVK